MNNRYFIRSILSMINGDVRVSNDCGTFNSINALDRITCGPAQTNSGSIEVYDSFFFNISCIGTNDDIRYYGGAAIWARFAQTVQIRRCTFAQCTASGSGGAILAYGKYNGVKIEYENLCFCNCTTGNIGSAIESYAREYNVNMPHSLKTSTFIQCDTPRLVVLMFSGKAEMKNLNFTHNRWNGVTHSNYEIRYQSAAREEGQANAPTEAFGYFGLVGFLLDGGEEARMEKCSFTFNYYPHNFLAFAPSQTGQHETLMKQYLSMTNFIGNKYDANEYLIVMLTLGAPWEQSSETSITNCVFRQNSPNPVRIINRYVGSAILTDCGFDGGLYYIRKEGGSLVSSTNNAKTDILDLGLHSTANCRVYTLDVPENPDPPTKGGLRDGWIPIFLGLLKTIPRA